MAENRKSADKAFDLALEKFGAKYSSAMECLRKDRDELLKFYDFPAEYWIHIRTNNPIESAFSSIRLRTSTGRPCAPNVPYVPAHPSARARRRSCRA